MQANTNTPANAQQGTKAARKPRTNTNTKAQAQTATVAPATQAAPQSLAAQLAAAAAAPAPAPKVAKVRSAPTTLLTAGKVFQPRTNQLGQADDKGRWAQQRNWGTVLTLLSNNGGTATYDQLVAAILADAEKGGYTATCNARGFVQGRVRGGHLKAVA